MASSAFILTIRDAQLRVLEQRLGVPIFERTMVKHPREAHPQRFAEVSDEGLFNLVRQVSEWCHAIGISDLAARGVVRELVLGFGEDFLETHYRWMQDCMEVGYSVLPRGNGVATRHRIEAVMQAYRASPIGRLKKFPRTLLDADFGFHFPGRASERASHVDATAGAPRGSKARKAAFSQRSKTSAYPANSARRLRRERSEMPPRAVSRS